MPDPAPTPDLRLGAVVLTGGTAARMDGVDKASIEIGGVTLLERTLAAAGLLAGLSLLRGAPELVCVLAVDMPKVSTGTVPRLVRAVTEAPTADGAWLVDADGREQPLAAVYRTTSLVAARPAARGDEHGLPMRRLVAGLRMVPVSPVGDEARDVDTWADLRDLRE